MVVLVAEKSGHCGDIAEFLDRGLDFVHREIVVLVDDEFLFAQAAGQDAGAVQPVGGGVRTFSVGDLFCLMESGIPARGQRVSGRSGDSGDP
jgi:hypothetical protein